MARMLESSPEVQEALEFARGTVSKFKEGGATQIFEGNARGDGQTWVRATGRAGMGEPQQQF